ncbi:tyrosine protein phosphatase [Frankia sp. R43]|nr:tyrosine protein phosphatase [Frankia sp. R43]
MRPTLYTVHQPGPGRLSIMAKPRGLDWLDDEMAALAAAGVDLLVCALTQHELDELGLSEEASAARNAGLRFVALPIPDRQVPELAAVLPALRHLAEQLRRGAHIVTHCRFGIGRASLLAAAILILNDVDPTIAWQQLEQARGQTVPDTPEQREWVNKLLERASIDKSDSRE